MVQNEDKVQGYDGFNARGNGMLFGYDYVYRGNVVGLGGFYSVGEVENDNAGNFTSNIESLGVSIYNKFGSKFTKGFYNINSFSYLENNYQNERKVKLPNLNEIIKSDFGGISMNARSEVGYHFNVIKSSLFSPKIALEYFIDNRDKYEETGSENVAFKVKEEEFDSLIFSAGLDFGGKYYTTKRSLLSPMIDINWRKYLGSKEQSRKMAYNNSNEYFAINSSELPSDYLNVAINAEYSKAANDFHINPVFNVKYNTMIADDFISHSFGLEVRYNFNSRLIRSSDN
jgi:uncharacterized protein with beta-barrel porin domain